MQFSSPAQLISLGGAILFNQDYANGDNYFITDVDGLDGFPVRAPMDDKAQTSGGILHDFFAGPRHLTVTGLLLPGSSLASRRNLMEKNLRIACRNMLLNDDEGFWRWQPDGEALLSLVVKCDQQPTYPGPGVLKQFIFGLVAADPFYDDG